MNQIVTDVRGQQVGGNHNLHLTIHPDEFAMVNGYDACAFSTLKYLTRFRGKNGVQDLRKAANFVDRREMILETSFNCTFWKCRRSPITMERYILANEIPATDVPSLLALDKLVYCSPHNRSKYSALLKAHIESLIVWESDAA